MEKRTLLGLAAGLFCCTAAIAAKPNIVFILVDDLGYSDVGFNGSTYYETPNLDRLAQQGLVLEDTYMYPTCSPSRTVIATGKQSFRTGVFTVPVLETGSDQENVFSRWTVGEEHTMYSQPLAKAGYQSIHLGKWHLVGPYPREEEAATFPLTEKLTQPDPADFSWVPYHKSDACAKYYPRGRGYLENIGGTYRGDPALEAGGYHSETGGYFAPFSNPFLKEKNPKDKWLTDHLTTEAIQFIDEHKDGPFFVNLHYYTVHAPLRARSKEAFEKYMAKPGDPVTGQGLGRRRAHMARYATMIESMDQNVQRIVDYLDANGLRENTMIVFTSDNGGKNANNPMRGFKGYAYEGGIRVPAMINWPGKVKPHRVTTPVTGLDLFPTFMDVAGIDYTGVLDGNSLTDLFTGDSKTLQERTLFWHLPSQWKMGTCSVMRHKQFKLIQFLKDGSLELYDLSNDLAESHNLAAERPELAQQMRKQLSDWRQTNHAPLPPESTLAH